MAHPYPRFSATEMDARRRSFTEVMAAQSVDHVLIYGADKSGSAVAWITRWPVTREAMVVFSPGLQDVLFVNFYNHVPNARRLATESEVRWGNVIIDSALAELQRRGGRDKRIGVIGPLGYAPGRKLEDFASTVVDLNAAYLDLRLVKSAEELEWLRVGSALTDAAVGALRDHARPGMSERELGNLVERAYVGSGAATHIHYFGATSMLDPAMAVPAQWPSTRTLMPADALMCEVSASFWDHPGQLLRTFAVGREPTSLYRELHDVADAAFDAIVSQLRPGASAQDLFQAALVIEDAGLTTCDDLVHGFVGGYLPPVIGSASRRLGPVPDFRIEQGMTIVVQPNVITPDGHAGVQTGELVLVGERGPKPLHRFERGFLRVG
jgi:Xaa-Pro dipeptidase